MDEKVFDNVTKPPPYIVNGNKTNKKVPGGPPSNIDIDDDASFVYRTFKHEPEKIDGSGGTFYKIDSTNFPISETIAATFVTLKPGALRELHWHPNVSVES